MEDPDGRRRRLKNTWQKNARNKTKELLGQLEKLLPEVSSRRAGCVNEAQILESACALFRRAVWTPRDVIRIGLSSSKSVLFVVVHLSTLAVESRSEGFSRLFKSVGTPAPSLVHWAASRPTTLIDFAHPEDAPHIQSSMSLAVSLTRQGVHDRPSLVVRLRTGAEAPVTGKSIWGWYRLTFGDIVGGVVAIYITEAQRGERDIGQASGVCTGAHGTSGSESRLSSHSPPEALEGQNANEQEIKVLSSTEIEAVGICPTTLTVLAVSPALARYFELLPCKSIVGQSFAHLVHPRQSLLVCEFLRHPGPGIELDAQAKNIPGSSTQAFMSNSAPHTSHKQGEPTACVCTHSSTGTSDIGNGTVSWSGGGSGSDVVESGGTSDIALEMQGRSEKISNNSSNPSASEQSVGSDIGSPSGDEGRSGSRSGSRCGSRSGSNRGGTSDSNSGGGDRHSNSDTCSDDGTGASSEHGSASGSASEKVSLLSDSKTSQPSGSASRASPDQGAGGAFNSQHAGHRKGESASGSGSSRGNSCSDVGIHDGRSNMQERGTYRASSGSSSSIDSRSDDGGNKTRQGSNGSGHENDQCSVGNGDESRHSGAAGSSGNSSNQGSSNHNSGENSGDDSNPSPVVQAAAQYVELELLSLRAVRRRGVDRLVMMLLRRSMVLLESSGAGQRVFVLRERGRKRQQRDSYEEEIQSEGHSEGQATVRETIVLNEMASTGDLCSMVMQSATKSGSGVDPVWHLMIAKHLDGYVKDAVSMHASAASITAAKMLVRMSNFGLVVKQLEADGVPQVCLMHRVVIPTSTKGNRKMCTPWAESAFTANGKLHAVTAKDHVCAFVIPRAEAGTGGCLQVLLWVLKEQETGLVLYHTQCLSIPHLSQGGGGWGPHVMTVEGVIHGRLDLQMPYHYLHAYDRLTP